MTAQAEAPPEDADPTPIFDQLQAEQADGGIRVTPLAESVDTDPLIATGDPEMEGDE